jgi:hypothetical protein
MPPQLNRPANREAVSATDPASKEPVIRGFWTIDPAHLSTTCELLYALGGQETCIEVIAWRHGDPWPDAEADEGWMRLLGEGADPLTVRIAVRADELTMIRRRGRTGGPDSRWTTAQAFRAEPGAVALSKDQLGLWIAIDGVMRGARVTRPQIVTRGVDPETGNEVTTYTTGTLEGLEQHRGLWQLALTDDDYTQYPQIGRDFPELRALDLSHCTYLSGIGGLELLQDLDAVRVRWCDEGSFDPYALHERPWLRVLDISFTNTTSLHFLRRLPCIEHLDLEGNEGLTSLQGIGAVKQLRTLDLSRCTGLRDLAPLAHMTTLETLRLRGAHDDLDLSAIATLPSLRLLDLRECHARRGFLRLPRRNGLTVLQARRPPEPRRRRWREPPGPRLYPGDVVRVNHGYKAPPKGWTVMETTIESVAYPVKPRNEREARTKSPVEELIWQDEVMHVRAGTVPARGCRIRPAQGCRVWCPTRGIELYARRNAFEVLEPGPLRRRAAARIEEIPAAKSKPVPEGEWDWTPPPDAEPDLR